MKTKISFLSFYFISLFAFPQSPTLNMWNSGPQPGDEYHTYYADTASIKVGESGANKTWDYSSLVVGTSLNLEHFEEIGTYVAPIENSTVVYDFQSSYHYLKVDDSEYAELGYVHYFGPIYMGAYYTMVYSTPLVIYTYPFTYLDHVSSNVESNTVWGYFQNVFTKRTSTTTADGYGKLILPHATFANVLRIKIIQDFKDSSIYTSVPPKISVVEFHNEMNLWYDGIHKTPVLKIEEYSYVWADTTKHYKNVLVATGLNGINDDNLNDFTFNIYPNPAIMQTKLMVNFANQSEAGFTILTLSGIEVMNLKMEKIGQGEYVKVIDISSLQRGLYIVKCTTKSGNTFRKLLIK